MSPTESPIRLLVGKAGLDGHDRGAKYIARILRDAGFEVVYTGIRRTPEQIVSAAIQEDVRGIGLSVLSGAHLHLFQRIRELLAEQGADDTLLFGGGTIPASDIEKLRSIGVAAVFTPGASAESIVRELRSLLPANRGAV